MRNQEEGNALRTGIRNMPGEPRVKPGSLKPGNFRRCPLAMQQGDDDRSYPYPLPRNSGEWQRLLRNIGREAFGDYATMTAAGLAFYSLLGIVPVLIALATLYGLLANPAAVQNLAGRTPASSPRRGRYRVRRSARRRPDGAGAWRRLW